MTGLAALVRPTRTRVLPAASWRNPRPIAFGDAGWQRRHTGSDRKRSTPHQRKIVSPAALQFLPAIGASRAKFERRRRVAKVGGGFVRSGQGSSHPTAVSRFHDPPGFSRLEPQDGGSATGYREIRAFAAGDVPDVVMTLSNRKLTKIAACDILRA